MGSQLENIYFLECHRNLRGKGNTEAPFTQVSYYSCMKRRIHKIYLVYAVYRSILARPFPHVITIADSIIRIIVCLLLLIRSSSQVFSGKYFFYICSLPGKKCLKYSKNATVPHVPILYGQSKSAKREERKFIVLECLN